MCHSIDRYLQEYDKKFYEILKGLENKPNAEFLKNQFLNGYTWLIISNLRRDIIIWLNYSTKSNIPDYVKIEISFKYKGHFIQAFQDFLIDQLLKNLKLLCVPIGVVFFNEKMNNIYMYATKENFMPHFPDKTVNKNENIIFRLELMMYTRKSLTSKIKIIDSFFDFLNSYIAYEKANDKLTNKKEFSLLKEWYSIYPTIHNYNPYFEQEMKNIPILTELKKYLVDNKLITNDLFPMFGTKIRTLNRAINKFFANKTKLQSICPVCGSKYTKLQKNMTTCGSDNCKILKSRFKKNMKQYSSLSQRDFYKKMIELENRRMTTIQRMQKNMLNTKIGKIYNLKALSDILYRELKNNSL